MSKPVKAVAPEASVREVVEEMNKHKIASILVVEGGKPVGVITERDVLQRAIGQNRSLDATKAKDIMSSPVHCISPKATMKQACETMVLLKLKRLVVTEGGRPVGIVTITDLVRKILSLHGETLEDWEKSVIDAWGSF